ncbi:hypothetical protein D9619_005655 [Psilocybe cf. subviscida]|uniref:FAS1 domain-containing protein n=1 Tax=Psilocybe cf. subviscida TaxID=2480587 RepID=A0A8H5FBH6_9AGAR|nr:hypothetical protein D9619_005655 [Psilocybe cf. subviscida]
MLPPLFALATPKATIPGSFGVARYHPPGSRASSSVMFGGAARRTDANLGVITHHYLQIWLLAFTFGLSLAEPDVGDIQGELARALEVQAQQPLFYEEPPHYPDDKCPCTTIYKLLGNDSRFSLVAKALTYVEDIAALLNDSSARVTFFAPPDKVLRRPREKICSHGICLPDLSTPSMPFSNLDTVSEFDVPALISEYGNFGEAIRAMEELESMDRVREPDDDKRKKIIKAVIRAILRYHILPGVFNLERFGENLTYGTNLTVRGALDDQALRLRISRSVIPPATKINFFTRITRPDIKALNGLVHVVDSPLIPPPSVFQQLYMLPRVFSTLTSALQRTGLTNFTDLRFVRDGNLTGASAVTLFAPTNAAFDALPKKLKLFLFSPFGERALKKLIEYHIVPNAVVHSNFIHGDVIEPMVGFYDGEDEDCIHSWLRKHKNHKRKKHHKSHHSELISTRNLTLVTLLANHTLDTVITRERVTFPEEVNHKHKHKQKHRKHPEYQLIHTKVIVNEQPATVTDIVAFNGAIHAVDDLIASWDDSYEEVAEGDDDFWGGWEEWFLEWIGN